VEPADTTGSDTEPAANGGDRVLFWRVFWGLAGAEGLCLAWWYRERVLEQPVSTALIIALVPVLVLGHVNVFPASLAARLWRRRHDDRPG